MDEISSQKALSKSLFSVALSLLRVNPGSDAKLNQEHHHKLLVFGVINCNDYNGSSDSDHLSFLFISSSKWRHIHICGHMLTSWNLIDCFQKQVKKWPLRMRHWKALSLAALCPAHIHTDQYYNSVRLNNFNMLLYTLSHLTVIHFYKMNTISVEGSFKVTR